MTSPEDDDPPPSANGRESRRQRITGLISLAAMISVVFVSFAVEFLTADLEPTGWLSIVLLVAGAAILVSVVSAPLASSRFLRIRARRRPRRHDEERSTEPAVEARIEEATRALQVTAGLVSELEAEMRARMAALERLRAENYEFEKLAALRREEAEAVSRLIESVISNTHSRLGRASRRDQVLFFVAGLAASIPIQILVNALS